MARTHAITYCGACSIVYGARRKWCDCGAPLNEGRAPAWLACDHCGDAAIESRSGLFSDDGKPNKCMTCGHPGRVEVDGDNYARWAMDDDDGATAFCDRADCEDCIEWKNHLATNHYAGLVSP